MPQEAQLALLFLVVIVAFLASLRGMIVGLVQAWPKHGRGWAWNWTPLLLSVLILSAVVAFVVFWFANVEAD